MKIPNPPKGVSSEAKRWWRALMTENDISDAAGRLLLQTALEAFDRMREAQVQIEGDGSVVLDRFGQAKSHPSVAVERDARAQVMAALRQLNLDLEPLRDGPGRPGGS